MTVVNKYKYLGVIMSTRLCFGHSLQEMAGRAKRGVINIFRLLWSLGEQSSSVFFKLFDAQIQPMISYGAEVWGLLANTDVIEKVHVFALKRFLNVSIRTPNAMAYGELGRYPLYVNLSVKCIKYWLRILKMPHHRLPFKAYRMLVYLHENNRNTWATSVCFFLHKYGFREAWIHQSVGDENVFLKLLRCRLINEFEDQWHSNLVQSERFSLYRTFKNGLNLSPYLECVKHIKARMSLIRVRLGVSQLNMHKLRFRTNASDTELSCPFCEHQLENEVHFVLKCPKYRSLREEYIPAKYWNNPSQFRFPK